MNIWTQNEVEKILIQLDNQDFPFKRYSFLRKGDSLNVLGKGGFSQVFEAKLRRGNKSRFAIKVIGFGEKNMAPETFTSLVKKQKEIGAFQDNIVKVYAHAEIFVWLDEDGNVTKVVKAKGENGEKNCLRLQFVVMKKIVPVLTYDKSGKAKLSQDTLTDACEEEILKLAYDIGKALENIHSYNMLHRDIKLENIFYEPKRRQYVLGDFGIAKITDDGMASTVAYTNGYGAPEVVKCTGEEYDNTADIYSLGILLYLLLNELRFPDSESYIANKRMQYSPGYVVPRPQNGSDELCRIIEKMCMFDPNDRYQSMEEVLLDLEGLIFNTRFRYRKKHKEAAFIVGTLFLFTGTIAWKITFAPMLKINLSMMMNVFLVLVVVQTILNLAKIKTSLIGNAIFILGIYLLVTTEFSWEKLIFLLCAMAGTGYIMGYFSGMILLVNIVHLLIENNKSWIQGIESYRWVAVTLLSLSAVFILLFMLLNQRDKKIIDEYFSKKKYWFFVYIMYVLVLELGFISKYKEIFVPEEFRQSEFISLLVNYDFMKIGFSGLLVCIIWNVREKLLHNMEKN